MEYIRPGCLDRGFAQYQDELETKALEVLRSGWYVLGGEVKAFEEEFAAYVGTKHCVGLASGLDALWMAFRVLGIGAGDEVIVQANTYIASVMGITINGATPIFVEPDDFYMMNAATLEAKITERTKAILVVHLYGQSADMRAISQICQKHHLKLVEDCAQSHGATFGGQMTGTFGDIGCFSFYPSKNLGAFGDGGAIVTNDPTIAEDMRVLRNYGSEKRYYNKVIGTNSRLDELQAGLLRVKLSHMAEITAEKQCIGEAFLAGMDNPHITLPKKLAGANHVYHQFVVRCAYRQQLMDYLEKRGIGTIIHYPIPPHLAEAYAYLGYQKGAYPFAEQLADEVLSLPVYNGMTEEEIARVIEAINTFTPDVTAG